MHISITFPRLFQVILFFPELQFNKLIPEEHKHLPRKAKSLCWFAMRKAEKNNKLSMYWSIIYFLIIFLVFGEVFSTKWAIPILLNHNQQKLFDILKLN